MDCLDFLEPRFSKVLEAELNRKFGARCTLSNCQAECVGQGYGSICKIYLVKLQWSDDMKEERVKLPASVIIKVPRTKDRSELLVRFSDMVEKQRPNRGTDHAQQIVMLHNNEVNAYAMFARQSEPPIPIPACFHARKATDRTEGLLILEDLTERAALIDDISSGMSLSQVMNVASILAKLHSWCLTAEVEWKNQFPKVFGKVEQAEYFQHFLKNGLQQAKKQYPDRFGQVDEEVVSRFLDVRRWSALLRTIAATVPRVLNHGDLWTNNILFERSATGEPGEKVAALIDWQLVGEGAPLEDLCHLLIWSTSASFRRAHQHAVVGYYHQLLCDDLGTRVALPPFETFWSAYEAVFPHRAFVLICFFPALVGTVIKVKHPDGPARLEEMISRALAAYEDALVYLGKSNPFIAAAAAAHTETSNTGSGQQEKRDGPQ